MKTSAGDLASEGVKMNKLHRGKVQLVVSLVKKQTSANVGRSVLWQVTASSDSLNTNQTCHSTHIHADYFVSSGHHSPWALFNHELTTNPIEPNWTAPNYGFFGFRLWVRFMVLHYLVFGFGFGFVLKPIRITEQTEAEHSSTQSFPNATLWHAAPSSASSCSVHVTWESGLAGWQSLLQRRRWLHLHKSCRQWMERAVWRRGNFLSKNHSRFLFF